MNKQCKHEDIRTRNKSLTRFQCNDCGKWFNDKNVPNESYRMPPPPKPVEAPKILLFDLETAPLMAYLWGMYNQNLNISQIITPYYIITWSAKWLGDSKVMSDAVTPEEAKKQDDFRIVKKLWELFDQADIVIAHNSIGFDVPHSNARFLFHGLNPPSSYRIIDTLKVARKQFNLPSNKLDYIAGVLNIEHKIETTFSLWKGCMEGDQKSLDYMRKYNEKDVYILEEIYLRLRPWIKNHPNFNVYTSDNDGCSVCGSKNMKRNGSYPAVVDSYPSFQCQDCGSFSRGGKPNSKKGGYRPVAR